MTESRRGVWLALGAYLIWGVLPLYWKVLHEVPAEQILAHRIVWSFTFLVALVVLRREGSTLAAAWRDRRILGVYTMAAALLAVNWFTYIWSVNHERIVETSLGYYINPLLSVLLGVVAMRESLTRLQGIAVGVAGLGVVYLTWQYGAFPWIALVLATSFSMYSLLKKTAPLGALPGLVIETAVLVPPALLLLLTHEHRGVGAFGHAGVATTVWLAGTGVVTALPLLLFAAGARRVNLSTLGLLQYSSPTLGLLIGVCFYREPFPRPRQIGFAIVWAALALYWGEGAWRRRRARQQCRQQDPHRRQ
jgi:chloramphenicol-sensitive protein RarD